MIGDYNTEMVIHNATRDLHDATVKCEVSNEVGKSEESQTLDIRCKCREREKKLILRIKYNQSSGRKYFPGNVAHV